MKPELAGAGPVPIASPSTARTGQIENVHVLRGFAAMSVVGYHLEDVTDRAHIIHFGIGAVDVFFVISGFIMVATTLGKKVTWRTFLEHRIARIVPLYWAVTFAVFLLALASPQLFKNTTADLPGLLKSLFFIPYQKAAVGAPQPIAFVGWSLNYEMFFYALFAAALAATRKAAGVVLLGTAMCALVVAGAMLQPHWLIAAFYTSPNLLEFVGGMALGLAYLRITVPRNTMFVIVVLALAILSTLFVERPPESGIDHVYLLLAPSVLLVGSALVLEKWGIVAQSRVLRLLGDASYSIYLTHFFLTVALGKFATSRQMGVLDAALIFVLGMCLSAAIGAVVHTWVEMPMVASFRGWFSGGAKIGQPGAR